MKRRIIALLLAGALSLSGVSGLNVHAMEDDETEIIADSIQESEKAEVESIEYSETEQIRESAVETEVEETNEVMEFGETFEGAAIDAGSLHIDKTDVLPGDKIHIGFRVTGDLSLVQYANVVYLMPITGKEKNIRLQYNESTGEFESEFEITDSFEAGLWQIYYASIGDKNYNNIILFNSKVCPTQKNIADFVAGDFKVSGTDADIVKPEVDTNSLKVNVKEAGENDRIRISLRVTDDKSGVKDVTICYLTPETNQNKYLTLSYNSLTDSFETEVNITDATEVGMWKIYYIYAADNADNKKFLYNPATNSFASSKDLDLSAGDFEVFKDKKAPTYTADSLVVSPNAIGPNETTEVTFSATDEHGISSAKIIYEKPISGTEYVAECFYDEASGIYRAVVKSGTYMAAGQWMVKQIIIEDNYNNVLNLYNSQLAAGSENVLDLSAGNFIVNGTEADFDAPKIDEASISAEGLVLTTGNSFHAAMKVTDDLSGVEKVVINYLMPTGKTYKLVLEAADGDSYQGSFLCEESSPLGNWVAQSIEATDKAGNRAVIDQNLEGLSFGVYECPIEDIQVESGKDVTLGYRGTTLSIEFVSQNNTHVSCNRTGVRYSTGVSEPWTIEYTLMPREEGNTAVEVRNSSTGVLYKVYNVTVVQGHHNGCVGQDITFVFSSPVAQEYTLTSDKEGAALKKQSCKTTSISGGLSSLVSNQIECVLRFDNVGKYNIVLTGNVDNSPITLCFDVKQHEWKTEYTVDKEPTCTEEGSKSIHCKQCNAINPDSVESIEVKAHVPGAWEILSEATEDFNGVKVKYCTKCRNEVERASIPKIPTYSVTYDANGGQFSDYGENAHTYNRYSVRVRKGEEYVISTDPSITRDVDVTYHGNGGNVESPMINHHSSYFFGFLGWNTKKDGSGMNYEDGSLYSGNEDITLYAQWKAHIFDELYSVKRSGYEFVGWYTQKQGGKKLTSETYIMEDMDVYAHWKPGRFFIKEKEIVMNIGEWREILGIVTSEESEYDVSWDCDGGFANQQVIYGIGGVANNLYFSGFHEGDVIIHASIKNSGIYLPPGVSKEAECKVTVKGLAWRLYETLLKRKPDMAGWKDWAQRLNERTMTGAQVAEGFIFSDELINQNISNEEFVERMYATFLNRRSDPAGKAEWVSYLDNGVSRRGIFHGFAESSEFSDLCLSYYIDPGYVTLTEARDMNVLVTMFVSRCYDKALSRKADVSGLNTWCDILLNKSMTPKEVAHGFIFSQEMNNKNLSNEEYIKTLYRVFMDREADSGGLSDWMNWMNGGMSREEVFNGFADSVEFGKIVQSYGL